jgi:Fe-S cluster assembly scaffold protein SufB
MSNETAVLEPVTEIAAAQEQTAARRFSLGCPRAERRSAGMVPCAAGRGVDAVHVDADADAERSAVAFSNVNALKLDSFVVTEGAPDSDRREILEQSVSLNEVAGRLIYADDHLLRRDPLSEKLRSLGVILKPLERGLIEHEDLFRKHFMAQPVELGSAKFAALHEAFVRSGTFVYVPRGVEVELPIEIFHWLSGDNASVFPHTLLIADELSKVTVIEHFRSTMRRRVASPAASTT